MSASPRTTPSPCATAGRRSRTGARRVVLMSVAAAACAAIAWAVTGAATAAHSTPTLKATHSARLGTIVVDASGRTVYALRPETAGHLLCHSSQCLGFWPPVTVRSARATPRVGSGVSGHVGVLRRHNGMLQVTLAGRPLYRFAGDGASGDTHGQGIRSFGGTWHVIAAHASGGTTPSSGQAPTAGSGPAMPGY
jgi:predicted lipoprotein with Yx(FWY)xxD motif